jgi:drug/metabolite transporter (DMT)-like permease
MTLPFGLHARSAPHALCYCCRQQPTTCNPCRRGLLCLRGLCGFGNVTTLFYAVKLLPLADATVFTFLPPVYVATLSQWLLHEDPGSHWPLAACVVGMLLVVQPSALFGRARLPLGGAMIGLLHSIFSAAAKVRLPESSELPASELLP